MQAFPYENLTATATIPIPAKTSKIVNTITPVDTAYLEKGEFEFTGKIEKVTLELSAK